MNSSPVRNNFPSADERAKATASGMSIALWAKAIPDNDAIISPTGNRSFFELNANCNRLVNALRNRTLREGDSVAIILSNRPEFAEAVFACTRAGLRYTPVNRYLSHDEIAYIINDCNAAAIIGDARFADNLQLPGQKSDWQSADR
jgi:long-chain acyl-CoA synthetase